MQTYTVSIVNQTATIAVDDAPPVADRDRPGAELAYAEMRAQISTNGATMVDVPGLTATFTAGKRPLSINLEAELSNSVATGETKAWIFLDGLVIGWMCGIPGNANQLNQYSRRVRVAGLVPETIHTVKVQYAATSGVAGTFRGADGSPAYLQVVTL